MRLTKRIFIQLIIFGVIALVGFGVLLIGYAHLPARFLGVGRYTVTVDLPEAAGIYPNGNVTYRGTEVGYIQDVHLTDNGVAAVLNLDSSVAIPSDLNAHVDSVQALGEQYIALIPRNATSAPLRNGDVIARDRTSVPPPIDNLFDATNRGLEAIPRDNLKTVIDETHTAIGGLGPELTRIINGSTALAHDAATNKQSLTTAIDASPPVLNSQADTSDAITAWAHSLASLTAQLRNNDSSVAGIINTGVRTTAEVKDLLERLQPTVPLLLANLVSLDRVAITFQPNIEQLLVLLPQNISQGQAAIVPTVNLPGPYKAAQSLVFDFNLNVPPPCATGFLPPQQQLGMSVEDSPGRPAGDIYCRIPQDSPFDVRGARNIPCETKPWKRAPTVKMCESDEEYVPLNDGMSWKGDPNGTLTGQDIPQLPPPGSPLRALPGSPPSTPTPMPVAAAEYNPATGSYIGPDGKEYTQADLAHGANQHKTWQSMLIPPGHHD